MIDENGGDGDDEMIPAYEIVRAGGYDVKLLDAGARQGPCRRI